jgi:hypothetical protein
LKKALRIEPPALDGTLSGQLVRDLLAGQSYLSIPRLQESLKTTLGVEPGFLGTGITAPQGPTVTYSDARLHEFFAPNMDVRDGVNGAFVWILPAGFDERTQLRAVVLGRPPKNAMPDPTNKLMTAIRRGTNPDRPIFARFERFPAEQYSNKFGLPAAKRVFCVDLAEVIDMPIDEALRLSGHAVDAETKDGKQIFIWLYQATGTGEVVPATWGNVRSKIEWFLQ